LHMQFVVDDSALSSPAIIFCATHGPDMGKVCVKQ